MHSPKSTRYPGLIVHREERIDCGVPGTAAIWFCSLVGIVNAQKPGTALVVT